MGYAFETDRYFINPYQKVKVGSEAEEAEVNVGVKVEDSELRSEFEAVLRRW